MKLFAKMGVGGLLLVCFAARCARAEGPKTQMVQFPNGKDMVNGFLAEPEKPGRYAALIAAPEWRGMTDWVKDQATKLAAQGYVVLAVDFYGGKVGQSPEEAAELSSGVSRDVALADLKAAFAYLQALREVDGGHIGAIGWGMGGGYALELAAHEPRLAACIVNYGVLPTDPNDLQLVLAPVLGNFGAEDHGVTVNDVRGFEKTLKDLHRQVDIKIYDGAGNAFENSSNTDAYRPEAAQDAWTRTMAFLNKTMK